jgi:hypothetical protein
MSTDMVEMEFDVHDRAMPVHDDLSEYLFAVQKFITDPKQVFVPLLRQRNVWPNAGMNKEGVSATE